MGNTNNQHQKVIKTKPPLCKIGTGFNSYDYDSSPNSSVGFSNSSSQTFKKIVDDTLRQYRPHETDEFVKSIMQDVSIQYSVKFGPPIPEDAEEKDSEQKDPSKKRKTTWIKKKKQKSKVDLSFVPKENIVSNIATVFKYIKQLGQGASCRVLKASHLKNEKL